MSLLSSIGYYALAISITLLAIVFFTGRIVEIVDSSFINPFNFVVFAVSYIALGSFFLTPPKTAALAARRFGITAILFIYLKSAIDQNLATGIKYRNLSDHISIVTGGNSGIGFSTAKHLVSLNCKVILACRSMNKCEDAKSQIVSIYPNKTDLVVPMELDLGNLDSVYQFVQNYRKQFTRLDYLINNAGLISPPGRSTAQGLEELFGAMHIGHFALTQWLLDLMLQTQPATTTDSSEIYFDSARVINVASEAFVAGNFHPTLFSETGEGDFRGEVTDNCPMLNGFMPCCPMSACPHTNGYARAKLANIMHMQELQRRVDEFIYAESVATANSSESGVGKKYRRLVTASLHPGAVNTNIAPIFQYTFSLTRSSDDAGLVVLYAILSDNFIPSSFLDSMKGDHDLISYHRSNGFKAHLNAFPETRRVLGKLASMVSRGYSPDAEGHSAPRPFSMHKYIWDVTYYIQPMTPEFEVKSKAEVASMVSRRVWDISVSIVDNYLAGRPLLGNKIEESTNGLNLNFFSRDKSPSVTSIEPTPINNESESMTEEVKMTKEVTEKTQDLVEVDVAAN